MSIANRWRKGVSAVYALRQASTRPRALHLALLVALVALTSFAGLILTKEANQIAPIWFSNGILLGLLLRSPSRNWLSILTAGFFGNCLATVVIGDLLALGAGLALCNILEVMVAAWAIRRRAGNNLDPESLLKFARVGVVCAVLVPLLSGALVTLALMQTSGVPAWQTLTMWYPAHALGLVIITPLVLVSQRRVFTRVLAANRLWNAFLALGLLVATCVAVFQQDTAPLLFAILAPLLYVVFLLGFAGAAIGVVLVAVAGAVGTALGHGPLMLLHGMSMQQRILMLQFFMTITSVTAFPVGIVLSERRQLQRALRESEGRYRTLADYSADIIVRASLDGARLYISPSVKEILGWTPEELLGPVRVHLLHPEDRQRFDEELAALRQGAIGSTLVYRYRHKAGHYVWVESTTRRVLSNAKGQPQEIVRVIRDISTRKRVEDALAQSERMLRSISDNVPAVIAYVDADTRYRFINARSAATVNFHPKALVGQTMREACDDELYAYIQPYMQRALAGERVTFEGEGRGTASEYCFQADYVPDISADGTVCGFYAMTFDITARNQATLRLAESENRLRMIADNLPALIAHVDKDERYTFTNEYYRTVFGVDPASFLGKTMRDALGAELYENAKPSITTALRGEVAHFESERHEHGVPQYFHVDYVPDRDASDSVVGFYLMVMDITARKWAEVQQEESEQRLRTITDNLPVLISFVDANGIVRFCNATHETWLGKTHDRLIGRPLREAIGESNYASQVTYLRRALAGERVEFELDVAGPEGFRNAKATYIPQVESDGRVVGVYVLTMDMTAIKSVERELQRLARFDSLTSLANRRQFDEQLPQLLARAHRSGRQLALMFLDIDHFKAINDSLGHHVGDEVLQEFARRLQASVRSTDFVARLGGDEFAILLEDVRTGEEPEMIARKIIAGIGKSFKLASGDLPVTASIGVALVREGHCSSDEIKQVADNALYAAKAAGRNAYHIAVYSSL